MKKIIFISVLITLLGALNLFAQTNPVPYSKNVGTTNDTVTFGLSGAKILTVENFGTADTDTIYVYTQTVAGGYNSAPFVIPRNQKSRFEYMGNKVIFKSTRNYVFARYYTGDYWYNYSGYVFNLQLADTADFKPDIRALQDTAAVHNELLQAHNDSIAVHDTILQAHNDSIAAHNDLLQAHVDSLAAHNALMQAHVDSLAAHNDLLQAHVDSLAAHNTLLQAHNDSIAAHNTLLQSHVDSIAAHNTLLQSHVDSLAAHNTLLQSHVDSLAAHNTLLQSHVDSISAHNTLLQAHNDSITALRDYMPDTTRLAYLDKSMNTVQLSSTPVEISDTTLSCTLGNNFYKSLTADVEFVIDGIADGQVINVAVINDSVWTVSWSLSTGTLKWVAGTPPTQTTGTFEAEHTDVYTFVKMGGSVYGTVIQNY